MVNHKNKLTVIRTNKSIAEKIGKSEQLFWYTDVDGDDNLLYFLVDNRKGKKDPSVYKTFDLLYNKVKELNEKER